MRNKLQVTAFAASLLFIFQCHAQTGEPIFPKGELSAAANHTGNIWLSELNVGDSNFDPGIAQAVYDPGSRLNWHIHPGGQVLLITEGTGYYQERGKPARVVPQGRCHQMRAGSGALAWSRTREPVCLYRGDANSEGKDDLVRTCQR